jgi:glyoxylase-like metal-dependent hydrolase (beta-lactamase superfamily II)
MDPIVIDTKMHGGDGITAAFLLRGEQTALIETGPKSSYPVVRAALQDLGVDRIDWIIVTHIHLDHAGAAGTLARDFPEATVAVHTVGAPHLVSPAKLWASAGRIYGNDMDRLWGGIDPVPQERIKAIADGDEIELGGRKLLAIDTPGHARHHHTFIDDSTGIAFCGDALGVRLPDVGVMRPATPPPEFQLEDTVKSIERLRAVSPSALWLTHFGAAHRGRDPLDIDGACDAAITSLRKWEEWVRDARTDSTDPDEVTAQVRRRARSDMESAVAPEDAARMEQTTSYRMNVSGYLRYIDKSEARA